MIHKLFSVKQKPLSDGKTPMRRIGDRAPSVPPALGVSEHEPAQGPAIVDNGYPNLADGGHVQNLAEVGTWRAVVPGVVSESDQGKCVVLDREYSSVLILATTEFYRSAAHGLVIGKIKQKKLSIENQAVTTADVIAAAVADVSKRGAANQPVKDDERNQALYEDLVRGAYNLRASDLHFEIDNGPRSRVLLRRYGRMRVWKEFDSQILLDAVAAGFNGKTKAGTASGPSWSKDRSLNTITEHKVRDTNINGRFSTYPVISGLDVVVRLLESDPSGRVASLQALGYAPSQIDGALMLALKKNSGFLAVVGGTGSGKSTTLKTMMNELPGKDVLKRYSVEDPVEYRMPGVRQISIQRGSDDAESVVKQKFHSALRMLVRMDPDVVMIGEIRDAQSGQMASEMVQTGHRVLTTIHGDSWVDALSRMTGQLIDISPEIVATRKFLSAVMYQKLLPVLCPHCKRPASDAMPAADLALIAERFKVDTKAMYCASEDGCGQCRVEGVASGGTVGVTVVAEIFVPNDEALTLIRERDWTVLEATWRATRQTGFDDPDMTGKTAFEHALFKACVGMIDPRDIEADFESFASYKIFEGVQQ